MNSKTLLYILKRLLLCALTILIVITITFFVAHAAPGDPFASEKGKTEEQILALKERHGMTGTIFEQYTTYLEKVILHFDFGESIKREGYSVMFLLEDGMKTSLKIGLIAAGCALVAGVILGSIAALRRNKILDKAIMVITTAFVSMPSFVIGTILLLVFSRELNWFPANTDKPGGLVLPIVTLALYPAAYITRLTRSSMLDVLGQDYIRTARAKGVSGPKIIFGHALKNSLLPVITYMGPMIAYIVTGSLVVEQIFSVPGVSRAFINSITTRDYPLIMGTTIMLATLIVIMNLISDILYKIVDPRITLE